MAPGSAALGGPDRGRINLVWALALVDGLVSAGVEHVVVCPGSRSTPLALAAARHPGVRLWVQLDERSAAFFALGLGRATGRPAAVVATSGTAPANFYPAVIEARYGRVPLVVLSADRPHELREFGASQTVDQIHLYGRHAKWFADLPLPEDDPAARAYVTRTAVRAVTEALAAPAGPVHLNVPFREPLVPEAPVELWPAGQGASSHPAAVGGSAAAEAVGLMGGLAAVERRRAGGEPVGQRPSEREAVEAHLAGQVRPAGQAPLGAAARLAGAGHAQPLAGPWPARSRPAQPGPARPRLVEPRLGAGALTEAQAHELFGLLAGARRGLIVCGPLSPALAAAPGVGPAAGGPGGAPASPAEGPPLAVAVTRLAQRLGLPVLADPLSGVRCGSHVVPGPVPGPIIDAYDAFLRVPGLARALAPDVVLRLGGMPVSKPLAQFLERHPGAVQVVIDEGGWPDPSHGAALVVRADPVQACWQLAQLAAAHGGDEPARARQDQPAAGQGEPQALAGAAGEAAPGTETRRCAGTGAGAVAGTQTLRPPGTGAEAVAGTEPAGTGMASRAGGPPATRDQGALSSPGAAGSSTGFSSAIVPAGSAAAGGPAQPVPVPGDTLSPAGGSSWLGLWQRLNHIARQAMARQLARWDEPAEPRVAAELARLLPAGTLLFTGNSMPVRDVDTFFPAGPHPVRILANRGAAGIDGVVSTAAGVAAAGEGPVVLLLGDLSFYHDLNGLWAAARYGLPLVAVVVNNDGGGIFSFLAQSRLDPAEFEVLWGTPHGLDFRHAAALYGIPYRRVDTWDDFRAAVQEALDRARGGGGTGLPGAPAPGTLAERTGPADGSTPGPSIIEIRTNRQRNVDHHRQIWQAVAAALAEAGLAGAPPEAATARALEPAGDGAAAGSAPPAAEGRGGPGQEDPASRPAEVLAVAGGQVRAPGAGGKAPEPGVAPPAGGAQAGFVRVRGARYYVEAEGWPLRHHLELGPLLPALLPAGGSFRLPEPALLLHGFTGSTATWVGVWSQLAAAGPLLAVDLLGHGRSAAPAGPDRYRMEEQVADLVALLDRLGIGRVHLVGYSMGGRVALSLAAAAPERVASLVLESSSPGLADPAEREARRRSDEALARRIEEEGVGAFTRAWEELPLFAGLKDLDPAARASVRAARLAQRPRGLAGSLRGMGAGVQPPLWDRLPDLPMPVLCLAGAADAKYAALARTMAERIPRGRAVIVPGAGHTVHLEEPAAFVREVGAFWREHRP
ncbi:2-succinyl-5-enolpyruvyl-6-hydroxy-3-cyclohexene-1-carboxylic-acid synthase [Thermaerobacter subterraneus]|uniref:2-succinyl-5-enolpyruvyl-6-hydroxy-3- cyclohexene-1-carboxylic-acid synthase n=1 Tax=Thermaerobacter subterraneus TaxID=175696 RepID=UPI001FA764E4|nr:2-succinyl-5-enolpyruvyl-6-hydroxy-3-cyclohexene-1-carboxylic-acid synthase [Thermaerobacter subterraneus]